MNNQYQPANDETLSHTHPSRKRQERHIVNQDHRGALPNQQFQEGAQIFSHQTTEQCYTEYNNYRNHYQCNNTNITHPFNISQVVNNYPNYNSIYGQFRHTPNYQNLTHQYDALTHYAHPPIQHNSSHPYNSNVNGEIHLRPYDYSNSNIHHNNHMPCNQHSYQHHAYNSSGIEQSYPRTNSFQRQNPNNVPQSLKHWTTNDGHYFPKSLDTRNNRSVGTEHPNCHMDTRTNQLEQETTSRETRIDDENPQIRSRNSMLHEHSQLSSVKETTVPDVMNEKYQILVKRFNFDSKIGIARTSAENKLIRTWENEYRMCVQKNHNSELKQKTIKKDKKYQRMGEYYCKGRKGTKGGCNRKYIIVRFHQWLALYSSDVHRENCNFAPRIKNANPDMILLAYQNRHDKNPGRTAYEAIDLDRADSEYPHLQLKTTLGKKRAIRAINRHLENADRKCNKKKRELDYSLEQMTSEVTKHTISPKEFSSQNIEQIRQSSEKYKEVVYIASDIVSGKDVLSDGYEYILFTTRGKLEVFKKSVEMANNRGSLTLEVDCSGVSGVCLIVVGISDFAHKFHPLVHGSVKLENGTSGTAALEKVLDYLIACGLERSKITVKVLKDGSPSFEFAANKIKAVALACLSHMGRVGMGVGTQGQDQRGSLWRLCLHHKLTPEQRSKIVSLFHCHITLNSDVAYSMNRKLIARELLIMLNKQDSTKISIVPNDPSECMDYVHQIYHSFLEETSQAPQNDQPHRISKTNEDEISIMSPVAVLATRKRKELIPLEKVILQLFNFYIPEKPVYGPAFEAGSVQVTNGLESSWQGLKDLIKNNHDDGYQHLFQAMKAAAQHETDHQTEESFITEPIQLREEIDLILNVYGAKDKRNKTGKQSDVCVMKGKLPQQYNSAVVYCGVSQDIITGEKFDATIKNGVDLVVYLPSRWYVNSLVNTVYRENDLANNKGGCSQEKRTKPNNGRSTQKFVATNQGHIRRLIFQQLYDIHPSNIYRNKRDPVTCEVLTDIETMGSFSYTKIHGQRDGGNLRAISRSYRIPKISKEEKAQLKCDISKDCNGYFQCENDLEHKGKGMFHRLVIRKGNVSCNCENFHRTGLCIDAQIMRIMLLKNHHIDEKLIDWKNGFHGIGIVSGRLLERCKSAIISDECLQKLKDSTDVLPPPLKDPTTTNPRSDKDGNIITSDY